MSKTTDITTKIVLSGEKQYREGLKQINAAVKVNEAEIQKITAAYDKNSMEVEGLTQLQDALERSLSTQADQVELLNKALTESAQKYGESDVRTMRWQESLYKAEAAMAKTNNRLDDANQKLELASGEMGKYESALDESAESAQGLGDMFENAMQSLVESAGAGRISMDGIFDAISSGMQDVKTDVEGNSDLIAAALKGAPVAAAGGVVAAVAKIAWEGKQVATEFNESTVQIQNALGLTAEKAEEAAKSVRNVYKQGLADSQETAQEVLTNVMKYFELEGEEAEHFSNKILAIGQDSETTIRTARVLAQEFGVTYAEALDMIAAGITNIKAPQGEVLDTLNEYANSFSRLGYDAQGFLDTLAAGMDAGAYSVDKAADSIKEFYNKAASGDTSFAEALESLGFNADSTMRILTSGGDRALEKFNQIVQRLDNMQSETKQATAASALFGSQWEDVGTEAILAMGNAERGLVDYAGTAEKQYQNILTSSANIERQTSRTMEGVGKQALNLGSYLLGPFRGLYDSIENTIRLINQQSAEASAESYQMGEDMSAGVLAGWQSGNSALFEETKKTIYGMNQAMKEAADIHSPSRLFKEEIGKQLAAGVGAGWGEEIQKTYRDMKQFTQDASQLVRNGVNPQRAETSMDGTYPGGEYTDNSQYRFEVPNLGVLQQIMNWAENRRMSQRKGFINY